MKQGIAGISVLVAALCMVSAVCEAAEAVAGVENLLKYTLKDSGDGKTPEGYILKTDEAGKEASITFDNSVYCGDKGPSLQVDMRKTGRVYFDLKSPIQMEKDKKYLLTVNIKVKDLHLDGPASDSAGIRRAVFVYMYGEKNRNTWSIVTSNGSTKGWVTVMIPFDTGKVQELAKSRLFLRCDNVSGTIWFQNPSVVELPKETNMDMHFILEDGRVIPGRILKLAGK